MKILFTTYSGLGEGGAEVSTKILMEGLKERGHDIFIASSGDYENVFKFKKIKNIPFYSYHNFYLKRFFCNIIKKNKIEIIYAQDRLTSIPAILAAKECNIKSIVHFRDYWFVCPKSSCLMPNGKECKVCKISNLIKCSSFKRILWDYKKLIYLKKNRKTLNKANIKFANSNAVKEKLELCGIKDIIIMPILRDFKSISNGNGKNIKEKYSLKKNVVTFIGGLTYSKGIMNMIKIMPYILEKNKNVSFLIVGDGPLFNKIKNMKINDVILTGRLDLKLMKNIYAASDIILLPSLWQEPFSGILLEAAAMKKSIISSNTGGSKEILEDGKTGYLIDPLDLNEWKEKIELLIKDKKLREKIGKEWHDIAKKNYDKNVIVKRIENVWNNRL